MVHRIDHRYQHNQVYIQIKEIIEKAEKNPEFYDWTTKNVITAIEAHGIDNIAFCYEHSVEICRILVEDIPHWDDYKNAWQFIT